MELLDKYSPLEKFCGEIPSNDLKKNINVSVRDNLYLYNYNDAVLVERNHPILVKCRGLVLDKDGEVLCYPFDRFFNEFEDESADIDWDTAKIQTKEDGSLINLWWNGSEWEVTTRGSFYPTPYSDINFKEEFLKRFDIGLLDETDRGFTFMFEMITEHNRIVKWYDEEKIVLLGARNNTTFEELTQSNLDTLARVWDIDRPDVWTTIKTPRNLFQHLKDDDEGFVVVDDDFNRIKIKQDSYIKLARIKMLKDEDIFDYVMGRTDIDSEFLDRCDDVKTKITEMGRAVLDSLREIEKQFRHNYNLTLEKFGYEPQRAIKDEDKRPMRGYFYNLIRESDFAYYLLLRYDRKDLWSSLEYKHIQGIEE